MRKERFQQKEEMLLLKEELLKQKEQLFEQDRRNMLSALSNRAPSSVYSANPSVGGELNSGAIPINPMYPAPYSRSNTAQSSQFSQRQILQTHSQYQPIVPAQPNYNIQPKANVNSNVMYGGKIGMEESVESNFPMKPVPGGRIERAEEWKNPEKMHAILETEGSPYQNNPPTALKQWQEFNRQKNQIVIPMDVPMDSQVFEQSLQSNTKFVNVAKDSPNELYQTWKFNQNSQPNQQNAIAEPPQNEQFSGFKGAENRKEINQDQITRKKMENINKILPIFTSKELKNEEIEKKAGRKEEEDKKQPSYLKAQTKLQQAIEAFEIKMKGEEKEVVGEMKLEKADPIDYEDSLESSSHLQAITGLKKEHALHSLNKANNPSHYAELLQQNELKLKKMAEDNRMNTILETTEQTKNYDHTNTTIHPQTTEHEQAVINIACTTQQPSQESSQHNTNKFNNAFFQTNSSHSVEDQTESIQQEHSQIPQSILS